MSVPLRIAVLAKQVPRFEELCLGADGRLARDGIDAEINPFCRRAIAKGVELARATGGRCTVLTLGPPQAADLLAEAIAWGADEGILISDPAFAGSDTLATSRALAAAISRSGPFDLVLAGLNSVDGETGQTPPQLAELLGLPFLSGVRELTIDAGLLWARCERDDGFVTAELRLPALVTAAERLCQPAKVPPAERAAPAGAIRRMTAADLGDGPWGQQGSRTQVGEVRPLAHGRRRIMLSGPLDQQVREVKELVTASAELAATPAGAPQDAADSTAVRVPVTAPARRDAASRPVIAVVAEPGHAQVARELLGAAARFAAQLGGSATLLTTQPCEPAAAWAQGADRVVLFAGRAAASAPPDLPAADDIAAAIAAWARPALGPAVPGLPSHAGLPPWAILLPSTSWGREVAGRLSVLLDAGLTGDAVDLAVTDGRLLCWKPAFGGQLVAAVTATSAVQMATVRPGVLPLVRPRAHPGTAVVEHAPLNGRGRVTMSEHWVNDEPERLARANAVVCVGKGVDPSRYGELQPLLDALGAELAGTRKVTDAGWLPRSRQIGLTGRSVAPAVYLLLGASGKFNHMVGSRGAGLVVAVNCDPAAPVFDAADIGIVADWSQFARLLAAEFASSPHQDDGLAASAAGAQPGDRGGSLR